MEAFIIGGFIIVIVILTLVFIQLRGLKQENRYLQNDIDQGIQSHFRNFGGLMSEHTASQFGQMEQRIQSLELANEQKLEQIRHTVQEQLQNIQSENNKKLDEMRKTVDEQLHKTLEEKMNQSFRVVSERLEQVYRGLGEMQVLAEGVGDLKKVLSLFQMDRILYQC